MELTNNSRGRRDFFEKWVCCHKKLNLLIKYSLRDEYAEERKRSWYYEHDRIGSDSDLLKSLTTFTHTPIIEELWYLLTEVEVGDIGRGQVFNDVVISTYCYCYWLTPLPKKKIEILKI